MHHSSKRLLILLSAASALAVPLGQQARAGVPAVGDLFYTTYSGAPNVHKVAFSYDGAATYSLGTPVDIATTSGADGIIFAPDGDLLVGGQGRRIHKLPTTGAPITTKDPGADAFHLALDPSGTKVWASSIPGNLGEVPLAPFGDGTFHNVTGVDGEITSLAFVPGGKVYYTDGGSGGGGAFGTIDLTTFVTTRILSGVTAAHGMVYDPFTGDLLLFGGNQVAQIDPDSDSIIKSSRTFSGRQFDQGTSDGKGHIFVADNNGQLLFMDYSASSLVGDAGNFTDLRFLASFLDDVAPLAGLGAPPPTVPDSTSTFGMFGLAVAALALVRKGLRS